MLTCKIVNKDETVTWEQMNALTVPLTTGEASILQDHAEMFALLAEGNIVGTTHTDGKKEYQISPNGGACHVFENTVTIILFDEQKSVL